MNKSLASWFDNPIEESTELVFNEISNILFMVNDIILHDFSEHNTESTLILEASTQTRLLLSIDESSLLEVHVSTFHAECFKSTIDFLPSTDPSNLVSAHNNLIEQLCAGLTGVDIFHRQRRSILNIKVALECLDSDQQFHGNRE